MPISKIESKYPGKQKGLPPPKYPTKPGYRYSYIGGWVVNTPVPDPNIINTSKPRSNQLALIAARPGDPYPYVFGRCIADGVLLTGDDSGESVYLDILWSKGEIDAFESLVVSSVEVGLGGAETQNFTGTSGQAASTILSNLKGSYDALPDQAHTVTKLSTSAGMDKRMLMRGIKVIDPRNSPQTAIYSTNPALALAHLFAVCGYTVNWDSVATAANYCDELIGAASPQVKRWEIGGQIFQRRDLASWVQVMASYASCFVDQIGGSVYLIPDTPRASNHTVTVDDMVEGSVRVRHEGGRNVPDAVTVTGTTVTGDQISYTYGTTGGAGTETKLYMPFFQTVDACGRKAEETYRKARNNLSLEFVGFDDGLLRTIGDVGTVTNAQYGLSSVLMTLMEQKQLEGGRWRRSYYQYDATNYSDTTYSQTTNQTILSNPNNPPDGPTPVMTPGIVTTNGVTYAQFKIVYPNTRWAYLQDFYVTVIADEGLPTQETARVVYYGPGLGSPFRTFWVSRVVGGLTYTTSVYIRSTTGALGNPGTASASAGAATSANLTYGDLTNMHVYTLDGDGLYCTTSDKSGSSPEAGETWASRFTSSPLGAWSAGETWLGNQLCDTVFETEVWDSGAVWNGRWKFTDLNISELNGATRANIVALSGATSPIAFTDYSGTNHSLEAQYMKAKCTVLDSPGTAGHGLHVKLTIPVDFALGL